MTNRFKAYDINEKYRCKSNDDLREKIKLSQVHEIILCIK